MTHRVAQISAQRRGTSPSTSSGQALGHPSSTYSLAPPPTGSTSPVIQPESSDARKTATFGISSTVIAPTRLFHPRYFLGIFLAARIIHDYVHPWSSSSKNFRPSCHFYISILVKMMSGGEESFRRLWKSFRDRRVSPGNSSTLRARSLEGRIFPRGRS